MNVLIVNAYDNSTVENKNFSSFVRYVKSAFKKCTEKSGIDQIEYTIRNHSNIDDYLYYTEGSNSTAYSNLNNKKNFEKLDFIFFDGVEKYLPWKKQGYKFQILLKMCIQNNKTLFASGVGMQIMLFFLATNFLTEVNIINSHSEIEVIEDINLVPGDFIINLKKNDFFLDFVTGDLYEYRGSSKEWVPMMNIGLHKKIVAEKYMYRGKYVLNPHSHRTKSMNSVNNPIMSINIEQKATIQKQYISHWLVKGLPNEFVVTSNATWFPHNFTLKNKDLQHKVICLGNNGPLVMEYNNSVSCGFNISQKYNESLIILENFILKKFQELQEKVFLKIHNKENMVDYINPETDVFYTRMKNMINSKTQYYNDNVKQAFSTSKGIKPIKIKENIRPSSSQLANSSRPFSTVKKVNHIGNHVGFGFTKRDMFFVRNNAVNERPISSINPINKKQSPPKNYPRSAKQNDSDYAFYLNSVKISRNEPMTDRQLKNEDSARIFAEGTNFVYNGDSIQLAGAPSEKNRIAKMMENSDKEKNFTNLEELKKSIDKEAGLNQEYRNFVPKDRMDDDEIIDFYKNMRRRITQNLFELTKNDEKKINKLNQGKSTRPSTMMYASPRSGRSKSPIRKSSAVPHFEENKKKVDDINVFTMFFPYVRKEDFKINEKDKKKFSNETDGGKKQETVKINLLKKSTNKYNEKFKHFEKDLNSFNIGPTVRCCDSYITEDQRKKKEFLESKKKWVANSDFYRVFGKSTTNLQPIPPVIVTGSPYTNSPVHHKFRDVEKTKWVVDKNFRV